MMSHPAIEAAEDSGKHSCCGVGTAVGTGVGTTGPGGLAATFGGPRGALPLVPGLLGSGLPHFDLLGADEVGVPAVEDLPDVLLTCEAHKGKAPGVTRQRIPLDLHGRDLAVGGKVRRDDILIRHLRKAADEDLGGLQTASAQRPRCWGGRRGAAGAPRWSRSASLHAGQALGQTGQQVQRQLRSVGHLALLRAGRARKRLHRPQARGGSCPRGRLKRRQRREGRGRADIQEVGEALQACGCWSSAGAGRRAQEAGQTLETSCCRQRRGRRGCRRCSSC
mmetsp:Transcript_103032/g.327521  ORF Transcript_103032/g.327521 Transcript_103032/m.327521 type:complete len:279 (-) Transcript_103032:261-1097(-)